MKKFEEPFLSYWDSPDPLKKEIKVKTFDTDHREDDQYRLLKEAIQKSLSERVRI